MSAATTTDADLAGLLVEVLGEEWAARYKLPLTADVSALVAEGLARHGGDPVAAMGADVDADTAAFIRSLPIGVAR